MSNKRNKRRVFSPTFSDVALSPVPKRGDPTAGEGIAEYNRRTAKEAEAARQAAIKAAEAALDVTMREATRHAREFWSQNAEAIAPHLYTDLSQDFGLIDVPKAKELYTTEQLKDCISAWLATVLPQTGYEFIAEHAGWKLVRYIGCQAFHGKDVRSSAAITACFERLLQIEAFAPGDLSFDASKAPRRVATPAPKPTLDDIEKLNTDSTEGRRKALAIVDDLASSEFVPLVEEWLASLGTAFNLYPNDAQMRKVVAWFQRNNAYWGDRRNYDRVRKYMVLVEREWPESALTRQESLELTIENSDLNDYGTRRNLLAQTRS